MGNRKRANAADDYYGSFLRGMYRDNPQMHRQVMLERMYQRVLTELSVNRFKWTGLPDSVNVRNMELNIFRFGLSVFFFDTTYNKFLCLQAGTDGFLNYENDPTAFRIMGNGNYISKVVSAKEAVPIWANYLRVPDLDIVHIYGTQLAEMHRTIEINSKNTRRNKVIVSSENQRLSTTNVLRQIDEGQAAVHVSGPMQDMAFIQALDLGVHPDHVINNHILKTRVWNECMGMLGIDNANQDKKERLVSAEVDANNDQTAMTRYVNLNERQAAAEKINKMFKLNVSVEYYTDEEREQMAGAGIPVVGSSLPALDGGE